ncbi:MAG: hypothetical protein H6705_20640 [Myxococcales bacterium]|nr:hypothetical protein [Myxococcales bacterium]
MSDPQLDVEHASAQAQQFADEAGAAAGPDLRDPQALAQQAQSMELSGASTEGLAAPGTEAAAAQSRELAAAAGDVELGVGGLGSAAPPGDEGAGPVVEGGRRVAR